MTITLDADWIADVSMDEYTVSMSGGTITPERFTRYLSMIESRLLSDDLLDSSGNIKAGKEYLAALLVCDLIYSGPVNKLGMKTESIGNYSYTKADSSTGNVKSGFLQKYELLLVSSHSKGKFASYGTIRGDNEIEFAKLTQGTPARIEDHSNNYPGTW